MLVKLTHCVNFINVLHTAFALVDPESVRTQSSHQYLLTLLGSTSVKAVRRMLMKSTPRVKFINILCKCFLYESALRSFSLIMFWQKKALLYQKCAH
jgi:hypothetical protein